MMQNKKNKIDFFNKKIASFCLARRPRLLRREFRVIVHSAQNQKQNFVQFAYCIYPETML